jgi:hypothetical protein
MQTVWCVTHTCFTLLSKPFTSACIAITLFHFDCLLPSICSNCKCSQSQCTTCIWYQRNVCDKTIAKKNLCCLQAQQIHLWLNVLIVKFSTDTKEFINEKPHFPKFVTVLINLSNCMKKTGYILSCYCKVVYFSVSTNVMCHLYYCIHKSVLLLYRHIRKIWESTVAANCVSKC